MSDSTTSLLQELLDHIHAGKLSAAEVWQTLSHGALPSSSPSYQELGFARLDHDRAQRTGFPEVIFAEGKQPEQILQLCHAHLKHHQTLLITRLESFQYDYLAPHLPFSLANGESAACTYQPQARTLRVQPPHQQQGVTGLVVVCAGTADLSVAAEIMECATAMGQAPQLICDVGVAGLHRLLAELPTLRHARVLTVVAGMEGALPSVVAGLVAVPVIAVPTSIGYGTGLGGVAALISMLNSCAAGMVVVNIDNGFGAARFASMINPPQT